MGKRTGHANSPIAPWKHRVTESRRLAAEERQAKYDALTTEQKLKKLDDLQLDAKRERTRLQAKLDKAKDGNAPSRR